MESNYSKQYRYEIECRLPLSKSLPRPSSVLTTGTSDPDIVNLTNSVRDLQGTVSMLVDHVEDLNNIINVMAPQSNVQRTVKRTLTQNGRRD